MVDRPDLQQALSVLDTYQRQIEVLTRQFNFLQVVLNETVQARDALTGLRKEPSKEILVPLGANTYLYAQAAKKDRVIVGIGASLSTEKSVEDAEGQLSARETDVRGEMQKLSQAIVQLQQEAARLQEEIEEDMAQLQQAPQ